MRKKKIYAVKSGRKTGIFSDWQKCHEQISGYPDQEFLGFEYRSDLEDESEDVPGSLRYAIKKAEEFLGDLAYTGESADCLKDAGWVKDGFLPFGHKPEAESPEVSDQSGEDEEDMDSEEGADEWFTNDRNAPDGQMESWEIEYWKIAGDMKKCVELIKYGRSDTEKKDAAFSLRRHLERSLDDMNLIDLTAIYRGLHENNVLGYKPSAVAEFVRRMAKRYPRPLGADQK